MQMQPRKSKIEKKPNQSHTHIHIIIIVANDTKRNEKCRVIIRLWICGVCIFQQTDDARPHSSLAYLGATYTNV